MYDIMIEKTTLYRFVFIQRSWNIILESHPMLWNNLNVLYIYGIMSDGISKDFIIGVYCKHNLNLIISKKTID